MDDGMMVRREELDTETMFVGTFIVRSKRERYKSFLGTKKRQKKFVDLLFHFSDFDHDTINRLASHVAYPAQLLDLMQRKGAPADCYVISTTKDLDQRRMGLELALNTVLGWHPGTLIISLPSRLCFYEAEGRGERFLLESD
jgi:hypothetical protein